MKTTTVGKKQHLISALAIILLPVVAHAGVLYSDDFSTAGNLFNTSPDVSFNSAKWLAGTSAPAFTSNGSVLAIAAPATSSVNRMASLDVGEGYFANNPAIYTLSVDVSNPVPVGAGNSWISLGFSDVQANASNYSVAANPGAPWMMLRQNGNVTAFKTGQTALPGNLTAAFPGGSTYTLKMVLDTTISSAWTLDVFVGTTQLDLNGAASGDTYTFTSNPAISYVGFSTASTAGDNTTTLDNFLLTSSVPEPHVYGLLLMGGLFFFGTMKKYRKQFNS